jgi:concanavalin A-like lectin/glucanase superfamily protein
MFSQKNKTPFYKAILRALSRNSSSGISDSMDQATGIKEEILRWIFSIFSAVLVYVIIAAIADKLYSPDIDELKALAGKILAEPEKALPEPKEALLFRLGIVTILPGLFGFYLLFLKKRWVNTIAQTRYFPLFSIASVVTLMLLIYFDFAMRNEADFGIANAPAGIDSVANTNFTGFFDGFFLGSYWWVYVLIVMPLVAFLFFVVFKKSHWATNKTFRIVTNIIGYTIVGGTVLEIVAMNIFEYPYGLNNLVNFNAVYYSMTQVHAGTPMLVNGFTNTYGLYPHFLNLIFVIIGLNILKFTVVMSVLTGLAFVLNFYAAKKFIHNQVLLFLGFATLLFVSYLDRKLAVEFDCGFALFPVRYIIPSVLVYLASIYLFKPSRIKYWLMLFVMGFFVLWNPEIGLVSYVSLILFLVYNDSINADGKIATGKIAVNALAGVFTLAAVFCIFSLLIYLFCGSFPDLGKLGGTIAVFSKVGFTLLPMPLIHPWNLVVLILISGFTYSAMKWSKRVINPKASMVFLLSLIGLGYLFYYQGRSHSSNLLASSGFCILLLTVLGDELWQTIRKRSTLALNAIFLLFLFLISFSFVELIYNTDKIAKLVLHETEVSSFATEKQFLESNREFLLGNSAAHEKVLVLTVSRAQSYYFDGNDRRSAFNPGLGDLFLNSDVSRLQNLIRDSSFKVFIEPPLFYYNYAQPVIGCISALYELSVTGKTMAMLTKRTTPIPADTFFTGDAIVHKKYSADTSGLKARIRDAFGIPRVTFNPNFSLQVLFFSKVQIYPYAALAGNLQDSKGFVLGNEFNSLNYFCAINDDSYKFPVPDNQWVYIALNVFPDHVNIYLNGSLVSKNPLTKPVQQSVVPFFIGNLGYMHNYTGAIAEVAVKNVNIDSNEIAKTWEHIRMAANK